MKSNFGIHSSYTVIQFNLMRPLLFQMHRNVDVSLHFYEIKYRYPFLECVIIQFNFVHIRQFGLLFYMKIRFGLNKIKFMLQV